MSKTRYLTELDGLKQEHFVICILVKMGKSMLWDMHLSESLFVTTLLLYIKMLRW